MARKATGTKKAKSKVRTTALGKRVGRTPAKLLTKGSSVRARKASGIRSAARKAA